jgi:hypothetical protein
MAWSTSQIATPQTTLEVEQILTPFENATKLMSGQLYAIRRIKGFLESFDDNSLFINGMGNLLLQQIWHYIDDDTEQLKLIV